MPTILRLHGTRICIYPNDHRPPHVHAISAQGEAVLLLNCPEGPPTLRESRGIRTTEIGALMEELSIHVTELCEAWERIFGRR